MPLGQLTDYMVGLHKRGLAGQKVGREVSRGAVELRRRNMPNLQCQWSELRGSTPSVTHPAVQQTVEVNTGTGEERGFYFSIRPQLSAHRAAYDKLRQER